MSTYLFIAFFFVSNKCQDSLSSDFFSHIVEWRWIVCFVKSWNSFEHVPIVASFTSVHLLLWLVLKTGDGKKMMTISLECWEQWTRKIVDERNLLISIIYWFLSEKKRIWSRSSMFNQRVIWFFSLTIPFAPDNSIKMKFYRQNSSLISSSERLIQV